MAPTLDEFFETIKPIRNKNAGGCLFFCYVFWLWLEDNNLSTDTFSIIQYDHNNGNYTKRNLEWIENHEGNAGESLHFTWMYKGEEYDACGVYAFSTRNKRTELSGLVGPWGNLIDEFCMNALENGGWNSMFDREDAVEECEDRFGFDIPLSAT